MSKSEAEQLLLGGRGRWREADESSRGKDGKTRKKSEVAG